MLEIIMKRNYIKQINVSNEMLEMYFPLIEKQFSAKGNPPLKMYFICLDSFNGAEKFF